VFISLPGDVLEQEADLHLGAPTRVDAHMRPTDAALEKLAARLLAASNPAILAGHELGVHGAFAEAAELAELLGAGVFHQTVPYAAQFPSEHPACLGALTRNQKAVRAALEPFDLLLCLGADLLRMSVYSPVDPLPEGMPVIHVSEREWELGKNHPTELALQANVKETLSALLPLVRARRSAAAAAQAAQRLASLAPRHWSAQRDRARVAALEAAEETPIDPKFLMLRIAEALPCEAVVLEEALTASLTLPALVPQRDPQSYYGLASGGLGFALPGAVGAALALPGRPVVAVVGDGSSLYGIQALWTAAHLKLPVTYVIANNRSYRILKERLVSMRKSERFVGMDLRDPEIDFVSLARSMGVAAQRVADPQGLAPALREAMRAGGPQLVEVMIADGFGG
jgi:benzoylformate decarboxylase